MPKFDLRCKTCHHEWEAFKAYADPAVCPECKSETTLTLMPLMRPLEKAKDPYDYLHGAIPSPKKVKSFAHDRRKGGKDTT